MLGMHPTYLSDFSPLVTASFEKQCTKRRFTLQLYRLYRLYSRHAGLMDYRLLVDLTV